MKPEYYYAPRGHIWIVYRYDDERRMTASKVKEFRSKDEARDEVYRLNGWKKKQNSFS